MKNESSNFIIKLGQSDKRIEVGDIVIYHSKSSLGEAIPKDNVNIGKRFKIISVCLAPMFYSVVEEETRHNMIVHYSCIDTVDVYRNYKMQKLLKSI
jgi:hypothetical protein